MIILRNKLAHHTEFAHPNNSEIVYLAAPIPLYESAEYEHAIGIVCEKHPDKTLLISRDLFEDNLDFNLTYRDKLSPVTTAYVLPDSRGFVGCGVYAEWEYLEFVSPNCTELYAFDLNEGLSIRPNFVLEPLHPPLRTMRDFARVVYKEGRAIGEGGASIEGGSAGGS